MFQTKYGDLNSWVSLYDDIDADADAAAAADTDDDDTDDDDDENDANLNESRWMRKHKQKLNVSRDWMIFENSRFVGREGNFGCLSSLVVNLITIPWSCPHIVPVALIHWSKKLANRNLLKLKIDPT